MPPISWIISPTLMPALSAGVPCSDHLHRQARPLGLFIHHQVAEIPAAVVDVAISQAAQLDPCQSRSAVGERYQHAIRIIGIGRSQADPLFFGGRLFGGLFCGLGLRRLFFGLLFLAGCRLFR